MNDGGPAFPNVFEDRSNAGVVHTHVVDGMSLRDWFAGNAHVEDLVLKQMELGVERSWGNLDGPVMCSATKWAAMCFSDRFHTAVTYHKLKAADAMILGRTYPS